MARHELFLGGGRTVNPETAVYPSVMPSGDAAGAAHKEAAFFALTRDLDFVDSASLRNYIKTATIADGDFLSACLMPKNYMFIGVRVDNLNAVAGLNIDVVLQLAGTDITLVNNLDCSTVSTVFANANGEAMTADVALAMKSLFLGANATVDVLVNAQPASGLSLARIRVSPIVVDFVAGRF